MSVSEPNFTRSPYFTIEDGEWKLKEGAPEDVKKEFEEFMKYYDECEKKGVYI